MILSQNESLKFKEYTPNDFSEINCYEVIELSIQTTELVKQQIQMEQIDVRNGTQNEIEKVGRINLKNFRRIFKLKISLDEVLQNTTYGMLNRSYEDVHRENVLSFIQKLNGRTDIIYAGPNYIYENLATPNEINYIDGNQWAMDYLGLPNSWDVTKGSNNVVVGIIDTGIDGTHPDLEDNIQNDLHRDFRGATENVVVTPADTGEHGTHVAGIVGAASNNGFGVVGTNWDINLASLTISESGSWFADNAILAVDHAIANGIQVLNYSGRVRNRDNVVNFNDPVFEQMIKMYSGLFVAAAGNDNKDNDNNPQYPANYALNLDNVISVGAIGSNDRRATFSNYGEKTVDIYAPGTNILSTTPVSKCIEICHKTGTLNSTESNYKSGHYADGYHYMSGTSMAAPYVSGVAALVLSLDPTLTGAELKSILINSADAISIDKGVVKKLNAYEAVKKVDYTTDIFNTTILSDYEISIDGLNGYYEGVLEIPSFINNRNVVKISDEAFYGETGITEVIIPNTVTYIGNAAFYNCTSLTNVVFEGNSQLNYISGYAFQQCLSLKSLTIPSTVTTISYGISSFGEKLTYYTDLSSDPSKWDTHWNKADWISIERPVVWGCTLSTDKSYVESLYKTASTITKPNAVNGIAAPTREGYTFAGWYTNSAFSGTPIAAENIATAANNVTYYARWIKDCDVVFDTNGGLSNNYVSSVEHGQVVEEPTLYPLKDGCVFKYWALSTNLNQEYNWNTAVENDIILQAVWEEIGTNYVVTFDLDGGEWTNNTQKLVSSGSIVSRPSSPTKVGYTFSHWALSGQTTSYNFSTPVTSDITLVAIWTPTTTRTVTFDTDGGYGDFPTITVNQYDKIDEPEVEPVRAGYYFKYWALSTNLNQEYNWNSSISQNITLVAVWESFNCIVTFDANGGTFGLYSLTLNVGDTVGEFLNGSSVGNPTRTGYTFKYWALSTNTSTAYNLNTTITSTQTIRLVAVWNINTYTVTFDKAGGSGSTPNQTIAYGSTATKPSNPTRDGYTFKYWALSGGTTEYNFSTPVTANVSLVAIWEKEESCVAAGTLITLADGRRVPVETLTGNEMLLVWNLHTGSFDVAPILFIDHDAAAMYKIINLQFSDGTQVKVIYEHAFWDFNLNKYVFLREDAAQYVGHWFNKQTTDANGNMIWTRVQLTNVTITEEYTTAWSPVTYGHLCIYVNGMLSMPGATEGLINIFEVDENTMQIDQEQYIADIAMYGLFTYEEFAEIYPIPEMIFEAFGGEYLKVSIGKGLIDYETLGELIERYSEFFE